MMPTASHNPVGLISLRVLGVEPNQVTSKLRLNPTRAIRKGTEKIGRGGRYAPQRRHLWLLEKQAHATDEINHVLCDLIKTLASKRTELKDVMQSANKVDVVIGLFMRNGTGGVYLDPSLIAKLSHLGVGVDLDVYCLDEDDAEI